ncbi:hypothetical protein NMG60_11001267 [Bertholletia excelsa]
MASVPKKAAFTRDDEKELSSIVIGGGVAKHQAQQPAEDDWFKDIMSSSTKTSPKHRIQKVPELLRDVESNKKCYDPLVVSIGPFHHSNQRLQPFQEIKKQFTNMYVNSCQVSIVELYNRVEAVAEEARTCYMGGSVQQMDHTQFVKMMFLDGCFVLQFILLVSEARIEGIMKSHHIEFVKRDLFLLENQLPYIVLQELKKPLKNHVDCGLNKIKEFIINKSLWATSPSYTLWERIENFITKNITNRGIQQSSQRQHEGEPTHHEGEPAHLLELMWREVVDPGALNSEEGCSWYSYRSVTELKASGICFRPNKERTGRLFTSVSFEPLFVRAVLRMPPMTIDDSTKAFFLNLVAYERCPDSPVVPAVTSYLCFIDTLIDGPGDVQELRKRGIILNGLGSDDHVADMFNKIAEDLKPNLKVYEGVTKDIESHYQDVVKLWITEWLHIHFRSPWTIAAFFAALLVFGLTITQTYLDFYPPGGSE